METSSHVLDAVGTTRLLMDTRVDMDIPVDLVELDILTINLLQYIILPIIKEFAYLITTNFMK